MLYQLKDYSVIFLTWYYIYFKGQEIQHVRDESKESVFGLSVGDKNFKLELVNF